MFCRSAALIAQVKCNCLKKSCTSYKDDAQQIKKTTDLTIILIYFIHLSFYFLLHILVYLGNQICIM